MEFINLTVRKATHADVLSINETMRLSQLYWGHDKAFMEAFMRHFLVTESYIAQGTTNIVYKDGNLIGFFSLRFHEDRILELDYFFVHPSYIGKGIGKQLWEMCCTMAYELGVKEFILWSNPEAELFYAKMGCEKIGIKKSFFKPNRYPPMMRYKFLDIDKIGVIC